MGHYYTRAGEPCHYQIVKSGKNKGNNRGTTIADARKMNLVPSVTTIIDVLSKGEGLTTWKIQQALAKFKAAEAGDEYIERNYAAEGTCVHNAIEQYLERHTTVKDNDDWLLENVAPEDCVRCYKAMAHSLDLSKPVAEKTFATSVYGGSVDIHDPEQNIVIDLKTKDGIIDDKKVKSLITDEYGMQLVAYREGLDMGAATCVSWFVSRTHPNSHGWYVWEEEKLVRCEKMFELTTQLWYIRKNMGLSV